MRATLLRRVIRQLCESDHPDFRQLAEDIVVDEERRGHGQVARELKSILDKDLRNGFHRAGAPEAFAPLSRVQDTTGRDGGALGTQIHPENLRTAMVLPPELEARFNRIETEYRRRDELTRFGLRPRRRILFHGPPGCGKTLGAERLAANLGLQLYRVHFDAIVSSYLGETASNLRKVFDACRMEPRLLLLDECDSIARSRSSTQQDVGEMSRTVNALLDLIETFDGPGMLVATTNLYGHLDPALFRRFDDVVEIPRPGLPEIEELLKLHLGSVPIQGNFPFKRISKSLLGSSAARITRIAEEAAKSSILEAESSKLTARHVEQAMAEIHVDDGGANL